MNLSRELAKDTNKSKEDLIAELETLRSRIASLTAGPDSPGPAGGRPDADRKTLELITGNIDEVIFMFSPDWREAIYVSPAYEHIWGRPVGDVYRDPRSWMDAIVPEDAAAVAAIIEGQARGEAAYDNSIDYRIARPDGAIRWIYGRTYPVRDERGGVCYVAGIAGDITRHKLAEERLKASERFLNNVFDCFRDGISVIDKDMNVIRVNHVLEEWFPHAKPLAGKKCYSAYHGRSTPCDGCPSRRVLKTKMAQREIVPYQDETLKVIGWLELYAYPLTDDRGDVTGVVEHVRNITAQRRAEEAQRESEEKYRTLVDNINDMVWEMDEGLRVTYVSARTRDVLGYDVDEVQGKRPFDFILPADREAFRSQIDAALDARKPLEQAEYRVRRKDGQVIWLETSGMPIFDRTGKIAGYRGINRDVTGRKNTEMQLKLTQFSIDHAADMALWLDRAGTLLYVNEVYCKATGYGRDELLGRKIFDVNPNFDASNWAAHWEETRRRGSMTFESTNQRKDGTEFPVEVSINFLVYEGQEMHCTFARDITDRKRAEESLRLMQYVIDQAQDEASLAGPDGRFVYVNDAKCRSLGYTRDELLTKHVWEVDPGLSRESWPEIWQDLKEKRYFRREALHRTKDGTVFLTEIWSTYLNFHGNEYVCAFVRDISERKRAEAEALKSNEKFRSLVENVNDWVWEVDADRRYTYSSPRVRDLLGCAPGEMLGKTPFDFMPPEEARRVEEMWRTIVEKREAFELLENQLVRVDGRHVVVETNGTPLFDDDGRFAGYIGVDRDITDRKRVEKSLKFTQFTMDRAAEMILWVAPDSRFTYVNEAACRAFGYTREEMTAMSTFDLYPVWNDASWAAHWQELRERGSFTFEASLKRKDGSFFPTEVSVNYLVYDGQEYNCSFIRDISERKRVENVLRESEHKFRKLAELTKAGIVLYRDRKFIYVNPMLEKNTGYSKDELTDMDFWDVVHPDHREMVRGRGMARQRGKDVPSTYEFKIMTKGGETKWVELSAMPVEYEGKPTILCTIYDITDRKQAEAELHEAKAQAELYLDLMGHDINNLNQIGIGFLEMALDTIRLSPEEKELIARPLEALEASTRLIGNVRKLQKVREGGFKFHDIDVVKCIGDIVPRYSDVPGRDIRINYTTACDCVVRANDLLDDVFSNLIGNAIKHSSGRLDIDVFVSKARAGDREYCLTAIEDNGPGIPDALKERLFSRSGYPEAKGSRKGMGLYLVRTLVEGFEGKVWVEDRVRGDHTGGARFMVMLPTVEPQRHEDKKMQ